MSFFDKFFKVRKNKSDKKGHQQAITIATEVKTITDILDSTNNSLTPILDYKMSSEYKNTFESLQNNFWKFHQ